MLITAPEIRVILCSRELPYVQCTKNRLTRKDYIANCKIFQEHQLNSKRLPVSPRVISNSRSCRHPVQWQTGYRPDWIGGFWRRCFSVSRRSQLDSGVRDCSLHSCKITQISWRFTPSQPVRLSSHLFWVWYVYFVLNFSLPFLFFFQFLCNRSNWLTVSFWWHVNITVSCRIITTILVETFSIELKTLLSSPLDN